MRRPSQKGSGKETEDIEDQTGDKGGDNEGETVECEEEQNDLTDDDGDQESQSQVSTLKKPIVPHKKIKLCKGTQEVSELEKLEAELQKPKPDKKFVKKAMGTTFVQRRWWIQEDCPSVQQILLKYPIFKKSKYVSVANITCIFSSIVCTC